MPAGLDSSTTFQIVRCLRDLCHVSEVGVASKLLWVQALPM